MPFDSIPPGSRWGDPSAPICRSCQLPIGRDERAEELRFAPHPEHWLEEMNGPYHAECAKPYFSMKRALDALAAAWS